MKRARILLVDDEVVFTFNMARLLTARDYHVQAVNSGESALEMMETRDFDVVVLDLKMPGLDGLATLREIKDAGYGTEVLILTGHGAVDTALEAIKMGAYDYLAKPCEIDDLVAKIEGAWERKDGEERSEMEDIVRRAVESPSSVLGLKRRGKRRCPPEEV